MPSPDAPVAPGPALSEHKARVRPARAPLPLIDAARCTGCGLCEARCPFNAIKMRPAAQARPHGV